jgi:hypothetical protein
MNNFPSDEKPYPLQGRVNRFIAELAMRRCAVDGKAASEHKPIIREENLCINYYETKRMK